jgi:hypothetical protein
MPRRTIWKSPLYIAFTLLFRRLRWFSSSTSDTHTAEYNSRVSSCVSWQKGAFFTAPILPHVWLRYYTRSVVGAATHCSLDSLEFETLERKRFYLLQTGEGQIWCIPSPIFGGKLCCFSGCRAVMAWSLPLTRIVHCAEIKK